jgi:6-phosphofructokinase 1
MIIEVMGRHAGWLATYAGICSGADYILIPEVPFDLDKLTESLKKRKDRGRHFSLVVVAEGATFKDEIVTKTEKIDAFGNIYLGGIGEFIEEKLKERFDIPVRSITLGHLQRGGSPTPYDRLLGTRFGYKAMELISNGEFGKMVAIDGDDIVARDIEVVLEGTRTVNLELYEMSKIFFD